MVSRLYEDHASRPLDDGLAEAIDPRSGKGKVAAELWDRSTVSDEALPYVAVRYQKYIKRASINNVLYTEHII